MDNNRYNLCVIGAEVNNTEQRLILNGIISEARKHNCSIFVLSNIYNHLQPERADSADNRIYELISDIKADAFILLSESFVNPVLRGRIHELLVMRTDIPVIIVGTALPEFEHELFPCINTSDEKDMEAITDKLIEENGFTHISFLTGPLSIGPSRSRIDGYRKSLEKHGIAFDETVVYEGNFWYNSGEELAERYLSGELPYPEALICANDYMAFGVLDAFSAAGTDITKHLALIGYEHIPERSLHKPLLTTYQRNRSALGAAAVDILVNKLGGRPDHDFNSPAGIFVPGQTCPCLCSDDQILQEELLLMRTNNQYAYWNLKSDMESRLTECRNYDEFAAAMGDELFTVRNASDIVLCLFENWFRENETNSDTLICRNINKYALRGDILLKKAELHSLAGHFPDMAVFYFNPVFFKEHLLGYCAVMYDRPDTYDNTYRYWLKSVSNGLEFLRLKTDINFLLQCSTLSSSYDGVTGLFSAEGMRTAFQLMKNSDKPLDITAIGFRLTFDKDIFISETASKEMISSLVSAAGTVWRFCGNNGIAGRISESELLLIYPEKAADADMLADAVYSDILFSDDCTDHINGSSLLFCGKFFSGSNISFSSITEAFRSHFSSIEKDMAEKKDYPYFRELERLRRGLERIPLQRYSLDEASRSMNLNQNYFNRIYKRLYGISFNQDQICSRIRFAKHLLISTDLSVAAISEKCDYSDNKYFIKQFTSVTGLSPKHYRSAIKSFIL